MTIFRNIEFFGSSYPMMTRSWHTHLNPVSNYVPGEKYGKSPVNYRYYRKSPVIFKNFTEKGVCFRCGKNWESAPEQPSLY